MHLNLRFGSLLLALALTSVAASGQIVDGIGGKAYAQSGQALTCGNSFAVTSTVTLTNVDVQLALNGLSTVTFAVYESQSEFGVYRQLHVKSVPARGKGIPAWYSSQSMQVPLTPGAHAIVAVNWTGQGTCYFDKATSQATSFGWQTHGLLRSAQPLASTLSGTFDFNGVLSQRLTTVPNSLNASATAVGTGSVSSLGLPVVLMTEQVPSLGNSGFSVICQDAPAGSAGHLFAATALAQSPVAVTRSAFLLLDPVSVDVANAGGIFPIRFGTDAFGVASFTLPVPRSTIAAGMHLYLQAAVIDSGNGAVLMSNAIDCFVN